ncbi:MAG: acyltransferase [Clostridia bacterium]|nr:acyltransferase [Clostridia bacterium]
MKEHVHYFDHLRLMAAISVIYMHVAAGPLRLPICTDWQIINVFTCIGFTAVPLFFMMSGYLLLSNQKTENIDILFKKRIPKLVIPLMGWTIVALLWFFLFDKSPANFFEKLIASFKTPAYVHFWYVYTLVALYIISPLLCAALRTLNKKAHILIFIIAIIPSVQYILQVFLPPSFDRFIDFDIISKLTFLDGHLNTFILGYYIGALKKKIPNSILIISGGLLIALISFGTYYLTAKNGFFDQNFQVKSQGF